MYKEFGSLEDLYQEIETDKPKSVIRKKLLVISNDRH